MNGAELSVLHHPPNSAHRRVKASPHRFHQEDPSLAGCFDHAPRLTGVDRKRFLAEDRFAGIDRQGGVFGVTRVRRRNVHDVHGVIGHERGIGCVRGRDVVDLGEVVGRGLATSSHSRDLSARDERKVGSDESSDGAGTKNAPSDGARR